MRARGQVGMTLIETLVAITLLGIIVVPLANALMQGIGSTNQETTQRLVESHDMQLVAVHLPGDLKSAAAVDTDPAAAGGACGSGNHLLTLRWTEADTASTATGYKVSYARDSADPSELVRWQCVDGGTPTRLSVAHYVSDATVATSGAETTLTLTNTNGDVFEISGVGRTRT